MRLWTIGCGAFAFAMALFAAPSPPIPQRSEARNAPGEAVGTPSCSARSCHGRDDPLPGQRIGRHEYSAWNFSDPHTRSYQVLFSDLSQSIAEKMKLGRPASEEPRCLACHAEKSKEYGKPPFGSVGCESCHGLAWQWLDPHTAGKGWRDRFPEAAKSLLDVDDLAKTARSCVGCHIGAPPANGIGLRDMNHDMIAAGHPRLNFEFAGYLAQLPPHWNAAAHPRDADFYARAWAVGQAVSAEAALKLLEYRASQPTWPELAEFACYACHHNLNGWRKELHSKGDLPWGSWYFAALKPIAPESAAKFDELAAKMANRPDGPTVENLVKPLKPLIDRVINASGGKRDRTALRATVARDLKAAASRDWDGAAQLYLALAALSADADRARLLGYWKDLRQPRGFSADREQYLRKLDALLDFAGAK